MPKSLVGFASQSQYVGVGLQCKQFTNKWYTTRFKEEDEVPDYSSTVKPSMTPEKKLIYQVFVLLGVHEENVTRTEFGLKYIVNNTKDITVELKRAVIENSMKEAPKTSADAILATLSTVYQETIDSEAGVDAADELDIGDGLDDRVQSDEPATPQTRTTRASKTEKISKKKMHPQIGIDLWKAGREEFAKKDVVAIRAAAALCQEPKGELRECIMNDIIDRLAAASMVIPDDLLYRPSWKKYVRNVDNNLGLK
mmetsp:Transcript_8791/g.15293  ORF Transcript_8791/g.15293 Transcript_8791/m.15293 type:complete len:254 (+) Transcript_8791:854-1615(+)